VQLQLAEAQLAEAAGGREEEEGAFSAFLLPLLSRSAFPPPSMHRSSDTDLITSMQNVPKSSSPNSRPSSTSPVPSTPPNPLPPPLLPLLLISTSLPLFRQTSNLPAQRLVLSIRTKKTATRRRRNLLLQQLPHLFRPMKPPLPLHTSPSPLRLPTSAPNLPFSPPSSRPQGRW
jgi:hypothetical protein